MSIAGAAGAAAGAFEAQALELGRELLDCFRAGSIAPSPFAVPGVDRVRLCCLSTLNEGSSAASIQFFLRRMERALPGASLVVGLWRAAGDSATLAALRSEGGQEMIVLSLGELVALASALAMRGPAIPAPAAKGTAER